MVLHHLGGEAAEMRSCGEMAVPSQSGKAELSPLERVTVGRIPRTLLP